jgi:hypothetical protein
MYVCIYIYIYTYIHTYIHTDTCYFSLTIPSRKKDDTGAAAGGGGWRGAGGAGGGGLHQNFAERGTLPPTEARPYQDFNRNLLEVAKGASGSKLEVKKLAVVALLDKLPATRQAPP